MSDTTPSPLSDIGPSIVRTLAPIFVGWIISLVALAGVEVDADQRLALLTLATALIQALYYLAVRWLETRWPWFGILLGSRKQPTYANAKTIPGEVDPGEPLVSSDGGEWDEDH